MTQVTVEDGAGHSLRFLEVDGFKYPQFPVECVRGIRDLEMRPDDVLVCAYPKSGTHWLWEIIRQLLAMDDSADSKRAARDKPEVKEKDEGMLEMTSRETLQGLTSPRVLNTHVYFQHLPKQVVTRGVRVVTLVRDPRDVAVSYFHHHRKLTDLYNYSGDWPHYLPLFSAGKLDYGSWFDYHMSWEKGLLHNPQVSVLRLSYENIKQDPLGAIRTLSSFLGVTCSESSMRAVEKACCFSNMRRTKGHLEMDTDGASIMYRKGEVGDWKNLFTVAQAESFAQLYQDKVQELRALGVTTEVNPPAQVPLAATYNLQPL